MYMLIKPDFYNITKQLDDGLFFQKKEVVILKNSGYCCLLKTLQ